MVDHGTGTVTKYRHQRTGPNMRSTLHESEALRSSAEQLLNVGGGIFSGLLVRARMCRFALTPVIDVIIN